MRAEAQIELSQDAESIRVAKVEDARAEAEAIIIKGRAQAEAKADSFRRMLDLLPVKDQAMVLELIKRFPVGRRISGYVSFLHDC